MLQQVGGRTHTFPQRLHPSCCQWPACLTSQLALSPPATLSSQAGRLPLDFNSKQVTRAAAAQAAAEATKAAGQGGGRVRRYFPPASTDADSYTVLKFHPLEDSMVHAGGC